MNRAIIIRVTRKTRSWYDAKLHFQIELFIPVSTKNWERTALAVWSGDTAQEAIAAYRANRLQPDRLHRRADPVFMAP